MARTTTQAGKLLVGSVFFLLCAAPASYGDVPMAQTPVPPTKENVVAPGDLWDGFWGVFGLGGDKDEPDDEDEKPVKKAKKESVKEQAADEKESESEKAEDSSPAKDGLIRAKRLDADKNEKKEEKAKAAPAYKVYQAPRIAAEEPAAKAPLPPSDKGNLESVFKDKGYTVSGSVAVFTGWDDESAASPAAPRKEPPVSAFPDQFFPVFAPSPEGREVPQFLPIASSIDLEAHHPDMTRAVVVIHDFERNAGKSMETLMTLGGSDGNKTVLLAPQFPLDVDVARFAAHLPEEGKVIPRWLTNKGWMDGGSSMTGLGGIGLNAFTIVDLLVLFLADRERFPAMEVIVLAGHGAGGDFVQRYAALGRAPDLVARGGPEMRFVIANPSSYLYFSNVRPIGDGDAFALPRDSGCPAFNDYPYGLENLSPYGRHKGIGEIRLSYPQKHVYFFASGAAGGDPHPDLSCSAVLEGATRLSRAQAYERHIRQSFGEMASKPQVFTIAKNAGYDPVSLFGSSCALTALFGDGVCE